MLTTTLLATENKIPAVASEIITSDVGLGGGFVQVLRCHPSTS